MEWIAILLAVVVGVPVLGLLVGLMLPRSRVVTADTVIAAPCDRVWDIMTDFERQPEWHPDLERIEPMGERNGHPCWREIEKTGVSTIVETLGAERPHRLIRRYHSGRWAYFTRWEIELREQQQATHVHVRRYAVFRNPFARLLGFMTGSGEAVRLYLDALESRLAESTDT